MQNRVVHLLYGLGHLYKDPFEKQDLQVFIDPVGFKDNVPGSTEFQMVIMKRGGGQRSIPDKIKPNLFWNLVYGTPYHA